MIQERRSKILDSLAQRRVVKVCDLINEFKVSIETIRRDLEFLEQEGYLKRVYGGAVLHSLYGQEPTYEHREVINFEEKQAIAAKIVELINDEDVVFFDVGTTTLEVAKCLGIRKNITVITNATKIAHLLAANESFHIILLGGELRKSELSVSGFLCQENLSHFNANKAIIGAGGITVDKGITDYHISEAACRRIMIKNSQKVIVAADHSKFGISVLNNVCDINMIDTIVTDWKTPQKTITQYQSVGVEVLIANKLK